MMCLDGRVELQPGDAVGTARSSRLRIGMMHFIAARCLFRFLRMHAIHVGMMMMREGNGQLHDDADHHEQVDYNMSVRCLLHVSPCEFFIYQASSSPSSSATGTVTSTLSIRAPSMSTTSNTKPCHSSVSPLAGICCSFCRISPPTVW